MDIERDYVVTEYCLRRLNLWDDDLSNMYVAQGAVVLWMGIWSLGKQGMARGL